LRALKVLAVAAAAATFGVVHARASKLRSRLRALKNERSKTKDPRPKSGAEGGKRAFLGASLATQLVYEYAHDFAPCKCSQRFFWNCLTNSYKPSNPPKPLPQTAFHKLLSTNLLLHTRRIATKTPTKAPPKLRTKLGPCLENRFRELSTARNGFPSSPYGTL